MPEIIQNCIDGARFEIRIIFTERAGHAFELAQSQIKEGVSYIVAVGGDGTVNEVAMAVRNTTAVLGIVPCGSGNGLARHLNIPLKLVKALQLINNASIKSIDYGLVNNKPFFCTFGAGFDARISHVFAKTKKRGFLKYIMFIISEYFGYRSQKFRLKIDGKKFKTRAMILTVANASQYGNNGYISPLADISDGKLDVCIVRPFPKILTPILAFKLLNKKINKSRYYSMLRGEKIRIKRKHAVEVHLDGDPFFMGNEIKIKVVPKGLRVLC